MANNSYVNYSFLTAVQLMFVFMCAEIIENVCKSGTLRVCEVKSERSRNYSSRFCELSGTTFRLHKELRVRICVCVYDMMNVCQHT